MIESMRQHYIDTGLFNEDKRFKYQLLQDAYIINIRCFYASVVKCDVRALHFVRCSYLYMRGWHEVHARLLRLICTGCDEDDVRSLLHH